MQIIARRAEGGMRDALSILDQALSLTAGSELTTAIAEEITGSISLAALDQYVAAILDHDATAALTNLRLSLIMARIWLVLSRTYFNTYGIF